MLDTPQKWREACAQYPSATPLCPGFRSDDWSAIHKSAKAFLAERVDEAYELGWRGLALLGGLAVAGRANVSACGGGMPAVVGADVAVRAVGPAHASCGTPLFDAEMRSRRRFGAGMPRAMKVPPALSSAGLASAAYAAILSGSVIAR